MIAHLSKSTDARHSTRVYIARWDSEADSFCPVISILLREYFMCLEIRNNRGGHDIKTFSIAPTVVSFIIHAAATIHVGPG